MRTPANRTLWLESESRNIAAKSEVVTFSEWEPGFNTPVICSRWDIDPRVQCDDESGETQETELREPRPGSRRVKKFIRRSDGNISAAHRAGPGNELVLPLDSVPRPRGTIGDCSCLDDFSRGEDVKTQWEDRFEKKYGRWRGFIDNVVWRYLDCGVEEAGFARLRCSSCGRERLLTLSCKVRGLCPSCDAKRAAAFPPSPRPPLDNLARLRRGPAEVLT